MNHRPAAVGFSLGWAKASSVVPMESHENATENSLEIAQPVHVNEY
jgi:hypothetical protein